MQILSTILLNFSFLTINFFNDDFKNFHLNRLHHLRYYVDNVDLKMLMHNCTISLSNLKKHEYNNLLFKTDFHVELKSFVSVFHT